MTETAAPAEKRYGAKMFALFCFFCAICSIAAALAYAAFGCLFWLRYDAWPPFTVGYVWFQAGLPLPESKLLGLDHILSKFLEFGIGEGLATIGFGFWGVALLIFWLYPEEYGAGQQVSHTSTYADLPSEDEDDDGEHNFDWRKHV